MSLPWGVKEDVEPANAEQAIDYVEKLAKRQIDLPSGNKVEFIAAGVKERKGKYTLILRYQVIQRPLSVSFSL